MNNQKIVTREVFNIFQACHAVLNNNTLKFVANDPDRPGAAYMLYADKSFWITEGEETEIFFEGEAGVCLRTNNRFTGSALVIDKKASTLLFTPYEGTITDFVRKVIYVEKSEDKPTREIYPILSVIESDIENIQACLGVGSSFRDAKTNKIYQVTQLKTQVLNTQKENHYEPYSLYDEYTEKTVYVKEVEARL